MVTKLWAGPLNFLEKKCPYTMLNIPFWQPGHLNQNVSLHIVLWNNGENYPRIIIKYSVLVSPLVSTHSAEAILRMSTNNCNTYLHILEMKIRKTWSIFPGSNYPYLELCTIVNITLDKKLFSTKSTAIFLISPWKHIHVLLVLIRSASLLTEALLMSTHNICFRGEIKKKCLWLLLLSRTMNNIEVPKYPNIQK